MKKVGYKIILILASIGVFLLKVAPINPHMHRLVVGRSGVFFGVRFFLGALLWQTPNEGLTRSFIGSVARQQPVSNNREVRSEGRSPRENRSLSTTRIEGGRGC
jgi:hypothetical protein